MDASEINNYLLAKVGISDDIAKNFIIFVSYFSRLSVTLASPKLLSLGNEKKSKLSFCFSLVFP